MLSSTTSTFACVLLSSLGIPRSADTSFHVGAGPSEKWYSRTTKNPHVVYEYQGSHITASTRSREKSKAILRSPES
jgi:hypothetical protein